MLHPFLRELRPTLHISHRGGAVLAPENTLVAFRLATDRFQTDMIEMDVRATADGELVVMHDETLDAEPVGMTATETACWSPSCIMAPFPYCFSMDVMTLRTSLELVAMFMGESSPGAASRVNGSRPASS